MRASHIHSRRHVTVGSGGGGIAPPAWITRAEFFGMNGQKIMAYSKSVRDVLLTNMAAAGVDHIRYPITWNEIESAAPTGGTHHINWGTFGPVSGGGMTYPWATMFYDAAMHGIRVFPVIVIHAPKWAQKYLTKKPTADPGALFSYSQPSDAHIPDLLFLISELHRLLGTNGSLWAANPGVPYRPWKWIEIGNETDAQNGGNWGRASNTPVWQSDVVAPREYANVFNQCYNLVKSKDANYRVISVGLAGGPSSMHFGSDPSGRLTYTQRVIAGAAQLGIPYTPDALSIHPYGNPVQGPYPSTYNQIKFYFNGIQASALVNTPLMITEFGWPAGTPDVTNFASTLDPPAPQETNRSNWVYQYFTEVPRSDCNVIESDYHTAIASETRNTITNANGSKSSDQELFFNLWHPTGAITPSATKYDQAQALMTSPGAPTSTVVLVNT